MENVPDSWRFVSRHTLQKNPSCPFSDSLCLEQGEEVYNFQNNPRDIQGLQVIMTVDESSYDGKQARKTPCSQ